jgi:hypothetical protein
VDLTAAKVIHDQHKVTANKDDLTPTTVSSSDSLDEPQDTQPLPLRWVKSETYANEKGQPVEREAKIRKLRAQLDFLHQRIDNLSLAEGRDGSREDE